MHVIEKQTHSGTTPPNLTDYEAACDAFNWQQARDALRGLPGNSGLNIAYEAVDRHVQDGNGDTVALHWLAGNGEAEAYTYARLAALSNRFANLLQMLDVAAGESVFSVLGRVPELFVTALGSWKRRCRFCALFAAFGPEPLRARLEIGKARVLVTTADIYRRKIAPLREALPHLQHVLIVGDGELPAGTRGFASLLAAADAYFHIEPTDPEETALIHFTSGTTGKPKGALHAHAAVIAHHHSARLALDLHPGDVYWCTADPGWVTGISYGVIAPLVIGARVILDAEDFDVTRWYRLLQGQGVNVWYTAPTAVRMMMRAGAEVARDYDLSALRFLASVGEPLNPEAVLWCREAFGLPCHDNWWQTETGAIMVANYRAMDIRLGSMGRPLPGVQAAIVSRTATGGVRVLERPNAIGELALRVGWPSMFRGYLDETERYRKCFADGWYLCGDLARCDGDGYYWFVGRADDVIKSAGHLIGPFEVESVLMEHPAVAEAGVVGMPDPIVGETVKAYVVLKPDRQMDEGLRRELLAHARKRLGPAVAPRAIEARPDLPKTRSGKIMRRLLKARELGQPEGDLSTLLGGET
ncbi:MAG: acetate--CoA ligase [Candidatus Thiodiazotropha sp.]